MASQRVLNSTCIHNVSARFYCIKMKKTYKKGIAFYFFLKRIEQCRAGPFRKILHNSNCTRCQGFPSSFFIKVYYKINCFQFYSTYQCILFTKCDISKASITKASCIYLLKDVQPDSVDIAKLQVALRKI